MGLKGLVGKLAVAVVELVVGGRWFGRQVYDLQILLEPSQPLLSQQDRSKN